MGLVEADKGGLFRSDDGGDTWTLTNSDRQYRQRAFYYTHVFADPRNADGVYVLNTGMYRSNDGGKSFDRYASPTATITVCGLIPMTQPV